LWLLLAAFIIAGLVEFGERIGYFRKPSFFLETLLFTFFVTVVIFAYLYKAKSGSFFVQLYLLTMVLKVLAYCAYNLVVVLKDKPSAAGNVVFFMLTYFLFTAVEIGFLYRKVNMQNGSGNEGKNF
jgi:hypothetical protein